MMSASGSSMTSGCGSGGEGDSESTGVSIEDCTLYPIQATAGIRLFAQSRDPFLNKCTRFKLNIAVVCSTKFSGPSAESWKPVDRMLETKRFSWVMWGTEGYYRNS